ncbi:hypothetical protein, partial [Thermofilum sp.]|uniref:hypothetical protein n=1 Tax=Thermofilum sp. TaxID=1961369 RepID=UPI0025858676
TQAKKHIPHQSNRPTSHNRKIQPKDGYNAFIGSQDSTTRVIVPCKDLKDQKTQTASQSSIPLSSPPHVDHANLYHKAKKALKLVRE